jgi:hypothetical protein
MSFCLKGVMVCTPHWPSSSRGIAHLIVVFDVQCEVSMKADLDR